MIARVWKGAVRQHDGDAYAEYMQTTGIRAYATTPGNRGVWMLRRNVGDNTEFLMFTLWDSVDSVQAFAGKDHETAVFYPKTSGSSSSETQPRLTTSSTRTSRPSNDRQSPT